jgi:Integrase core domain
LQLASLRCSGSDTGGIEIFVEFDGVAIAKTPGINFRRLRGLSGFLVGPCGRTPPENGIDRQVAWPLALGGKSENEPEWRYDRYRATVADENAWARTRRPKYCKLATNPDGDRRGHIKDPVSIRQRPAAVEDRAVPGHWEGDLLSGSNNSYIATLVERHTRYVMLAKVANKDTQSVVSALIKQARKLRSELYKSLTLDRGKELADHRQFTLATNIDVYFCDPQSPWQRGSNENTNGLLRQYFPKGTDLSEHSQAYLNKVARQLNERPRQG